MMSTTTPVASSSSARPAPPLLIRRAAVLGAGTMGSRIAAHLANAGIPSLLLDVVPAGEGARSRLAVSAVDALAKAKPAAFYETSLAALITPGNFEDDLPMLAACDWVIEAVSENLTIKTQLLARILPHLAPRAFLTTNTSGLPIATIAACLPTELRSRFFGAHFFNPPRYMRLLELIPTAETDPTLAASFAAFADRNLGKQVVLANDTPNFIGNRIGIAVLQKAAELMLAQGLTIEEVDALTGQAIGFPRSGTFRMADMVGNDVIAQVVNNSPSGDPDSGFRAILQELIRRGWLGDKSGQGFYRKIGGSEGKDERLALNLATYEYRPVLKPALPALETAKNAASLAERLRLLLANDPAKDKTAAFLWPFLATLWNFAADRIGEVAADPASIDRAMRAGYNWELGPFELWDAAGLTSTVSRIKAFGLPVTPRVEALLASGHTSWYSEDGRSCFQPKEGTRKPVPVIPGHARIADFRRSHGVLQSNPGASLIDLGDGIGCIELHSLKNAIGGDVLAMISSVLNPASDAVRDFAGFVIASDRENFSVGANLMQMLLAAQEGEWDELAAVIHNFQQMTAAIKFSPRPVVVAPFGMTFGGGAEISLHAARRQAHAETYIGLGEAGV